MNRRICILLIISVLSLIFIGTSCSSKKKMMKTNLRAFTAARLIHEVEENAFDFDNFQARMSVKIETDNKSFSVKGQLRMKKDSIIWTSISMPFGLEIMRVKVSPDSVFFLNRSEKTYLCENINVFNDISPMITSYRFLQTILVGNGINLREHNKYKVQIDDGQYKLKNLWIDPQLYKITKYSIKEYTDGKRKIEIEYSDFQEVKGKYIPTKINLSIHGDVFLKVNISYSNITVGDNIDFNFSIPKKYDRIFK